MNQPAPQQDPAQTNQPYGQNNPEFRPMPSGNQPGSTACKVWGIILLLLGVFGAFNMLVALAMIIGDINPMNMTWGLSEEMARDMKAMNDQMIQDMQGRWTFWVNLLGEMILVALSMGAGIFLLIKPKPAGRSLALARGMLVLALLPVYAYEQFTMLDGNFEAQMAMTRAEMKRAAPPANTAPAGNGAPVGSPAPAPQLPQGMEDVMRGINYGMVIAMSLGVLVFNGLLLFFISRPTVRTYLESVAREGESPIPGYDPSMGMLHQPPPGAPPPNR